MYQPFRAQKTVQSLAVMLLSLCHFHLFLLLHFHLYRIPLQDQILGEILKHNCKNELPDDFDVTLPPPIYFYDFLAECPSPWLHYGYCTPCLVVARFTNNTTITEHIARCPALLDQCFEGEHEELISEYKQKETELAESDINSK